MIFGAACGLACLFMVIPSLARSFPAMSLEPADLERSGFAWPAEAVSLRRAAEGAPLDAEESARLAFLHAGIRRQRGDDRAAAALYDRWLRSEPLSSLRPGAALGLGVSSLGINAPREARNVLRRARRSFPFCAVEDDLLFWEAEASWVLEDYPEAARLFRELGERYAASPLHAESLYRLAWVERKTGDLKAAAEHFSRAGGLDPGLKPSAELQQGWTLLELGEVSGARSLFEAVEAGSGGTARAREAMIGKAECAYREGKFDAARELYDAALARAADAQSRAAIRYSLAWTALKQKNADRARGMFLDIEKDFPSDQVAPFAVYRAALCLLELDKPLEALVELEGVQGRHPGHEVGEWSAYSRGWIYLSLGRFNEAKAAFRGLLERYPDGRLVAPAKYLTAATLYQERRFEEAEREFLSFARAHAGSGLADGALLWAGWGALLAGRPRDALAHLGALSREFPSTEWRSDADVATGEASFAVKDYDRARNSYRRAAEAKGDARLQDTRLRGLTGLGWCAFATRDWKAAERMFRTVLDESEPGATRERARVRLADALFNQKRFDAAEPEYQRIVKGGDPALARWALLQLGWCAFRQGKPDEARRRWEQLYRGWPDSEEAPLARQASAETLFGQAKFLEAEREFALLAKAAPGGSEVAETAVLRIGDCRYNAKSYEAAVLAYRDFTRRYPKSRRIAEALFGMQWAYLQLGQYEEARREASSFLEKFPQASLAAEVKLMVAESYRREAKPREALAEYHEFLKQYPASDLVASVLVKVGEAQEEMGEYGAAQATYSDFLAKHPDHPLGGEVLFRLGVVRYRTGDLDGAVAIFAKIAEDPANPRGPEALFNLVLVHKKQADELRMTAAAKVLAERYPKTRAAAQGGLVMGYYLVDAGRGDRSASYFEVAAGSSDPALAAEAQYALGEMYLEKGEQEKSLAAYLAGAQKLPKGGEWAVQCAFAAANEQAVKGDHAAAIELFRGVLEVENGAPEWRATAYFGIGQQFEAQAKRTEARQMYDKCLEQNPSETMKAQVRERIEGLAPGDREDPAAPGDREDPAAPGEQGDSLSPDAAAPAPAGKGKKR